MIKEIQNNQEKIIENEIINQNNMFLDSVVSKMNNEYEALERTGNEQAIQIGSVIKNIVYSIISEVRESLTSTGLITSTQAPYFMNQCMQSVNSILSGGVISPITGDEAEWVDTTAPQDAGQELKISYRGKEYSIPIESVQINKRYPKIYRINNDNNLAHRIDYFQFHDAKNPQKIHLTEDSIRFIQFPYTMQALHSHCIVDDKVITDYLDFDYSDIRDGLIYPDQFSDDPNSYVIASKIPLTMLEDAGIVIENEIQEYLESVNDSSMPEYADDEDFDDDSFTEFDED